MDEHDSIDIESYALQENGNEVTEVDEYWKKYCKSWDTVMRGHFYEDWFYIRYFYRKDNLEYGFYYILKVRTTSQSGQL